MISIKKIISLLIAFILATNLLSGCGKNESDLADSSNADKQTSDSKAGSEREPITVAVVLRDGEISPADIQIYQEIEEKTGVKVDWKTTPEAGWEEKRALIFASTDLPDAFFGNGILTDTDILKYGVQGMLIPLEDYITPEIMPNLYNALEQFPEIKKAIIAPDGHIYGLPSFDHGITTTTTDVTYINKDWLEAVKMDIPTTTDEFYEVLKAFKENDVNGNGDPNDEIPLSLSKATHYASYFFGAFGINHTFGGNAPHFDVQDGKVVFVPITEEYKEAITYFNKLFKEGLVDQESFTHDSKAFKAKLLSEERIVGVFHAWRSSAWALSEDDDSYVPLPPLEGPHGDRQYIERINGLKYKGSFAVTINAEDPEYIMSWVDNFYEPFIGLQTSYALKEGVHIADNDGDGKYKIILDGTRENRTGVVPQGRNRIDNVTPEAAAMLADKPAHLIEKQELDKYYNKYYTGEHYPKVFFTLEELDRLAILTTDINGYVDEMYAKWMQVGGIEEEWDGYIKRLNDMGLEEYIKIYTDAFERFNNAQ